MIPAEEFPLLPGDDGARARRSLLSIERRMIHALLNYLTLAGSAKMPRQVPSSS
jgi:hypothetical protein